MPQGRERRLAVTVAVELRRVDLDEADLAAGRRAERVAVAHPGDGRRLRRVSASCRSASGEVEEEVAAPGRPEESEGERDATEPRQPG